MGTTIGEVLKDRPVVHVAPSHSVADAARKMSAMRVGAAAVLEGDRLVGIVTERDIMSKVVAEGKDPLKTLVSDIMTRNVILALAEEDYEICLGRMRQAGIRHLPVVKGDQLIGIVSIRALSFFELDRKDEELKLMNDYVRYVPEEADR
ncbi:MAG: CBS domain-containing protein [Nitrospirae bacterium]|nr:CBS domain-containing protein [Nitrospirota bacterium]